MSAIAVKKDWSRVDPVAVLRVIDAIDQATRFSEGLKVAIVGLANVDDVGRQVEGVLWIADAHIDRLEAISGQLSELIGVNQ